MDYQTLWLLTMYQTFDLSKNATYLTINLVGSRSKVAVRCFVVQVTVFEGLD